MPSVATGLFGGKTSAYIIVYCGNMSLILHSSTFKQSTNVYMAGYAALGVGYALFALLMWVF
jgi:hypothetical protein